MARPSRRPNNRDRPNGGPGRGGSGAPAPGAQLFPDTPSGLIEANYDTFSVDFEVPTERHPARTRREEYGPEQVALTTRWTPMTAANNRSRIPATTKQLRHQRGIHAGAGSVS
jgi:hypothetical protein